MSASVVLDQTLDDLKAAFEADDTQQARRILWGFACLLTVDEGLAIRIIGDASCFRED